MQDGHKAEGEGGGGGGGGQPAFKGDVKPHYLQCLYAMCINVLLTRYIISETYIVSAVNRMS